MNSVPWAAAESEVSGLRLSEVIGALSYALDLTEGQPPGHCLRCCWIGFHVGAVMELDQAGLWDLYYTLLLKDAGCSSNAERLCQLYGDDDIATKQDFKLVDTDRLDQVARFIFAHTAPGESLGHRFRRLFNLIRKGGEYADEIITARCERGSRIALQLGFSQRVADGVHSLDEHWNGQGRPQRLTGDGIPLASRIALLAQVADVFHRVGGPDAAMAEIRNRRNTWFDPAVVQAFESAAQKAGFWDALIDPEFPERVLALEPSSLITDVDEARLDSIATAFAQVVDAKSHFTYGHSERVAEYAEAIGSRMGLSEPRLRWLRRGALLHDIGKLGVSNSILDKPGRLTSEEWEQVRAHPRYTEEILGRIGPFQDLARIAGAHHERLDGQGYPYGLRDDQIRLETRIITTADIFDAISAERPYRAAIPVPEALRMMEKVRGRALDPDCLDALVDYCGDP